MKKSFMRTLLLLALVTLVLSFASCDLFGGESPAETTTTAAPVTTTTPVVDEPEAPDPLVGGYMPEIGSVATIAPEYLGEYTIVYPETASDDVVAVAEKLAAAILEKTGVAVAVTSDFVALGTEMPEAREIRLGLTNRDEAYSWLRKYDYRIELVDNEDVLIAAQDDRALSVAVDLYIEKLLDNTGAKAPVEAFWYQALYPVETLMLGGYDISKFAIVRDSENVQVAEYLRSYIADMTGYILPVRTSDMPAVAYEIVIGNISRPGFTFPESGKYLMKQQGAKIMLGGSGAYAGYYATLALVDALGNSGTTTGTTLAVPVQETIAVHRTGGLFTLNLPTELPSMEGKYSMVYSTEMVLDRFLLAKDELPEEITVLERFEIENYPFSLNNEIYVSPNGDDNNPGTLEAPLATLQTAISKMARRNGGVIWMMGGVYSVDKTIKVTANESGLATSPLFIKAYNDEEVTLTSMKILDGSEDKWMYVDSSDKIHADVYDRIPEEARDYILYTTLDIQGWTEDDLPKITKSGPGRLFVDGEEYDLARYPNKSETNDPNELLYFGYAYDQGKVTGTSTNLYHPWQAMLQENNWDPADEHGWEIRLPASKDGYKNHRSDADQMTAEITSWVNTGDIWYYGSTFEGWEFGYYNLALTTVEHGKTQHWAHTADGQQWQGPNSGKTPYLGSLTHTRNGIRDGYYSLKSMTHNSWGCKVSANSAAGRNTYFLFNAIEALDAPGEWYYEKTTGALYIYYKDAHSDTESIMTAFSNPTSFNTMTIQVATNVILDGITFNGASQNCLYIDKCDSVIVQDCTFTNSMNTNLTLFNSTNCAIIYSDFSMAYSTMVNVSDTQSYNALKPSGNIIQNNIFHKPAPYQQVGVGFGGCRLIVSHNYFNNTNSTGSGVECIFEYNLFEGGSKDITDGGFIYAGGAGAKYNHFRYNLFHMFNATHNAVYNDTMASTNYMYGNIVSTLHSKADHNKAWYSSTGWGNVSYGNLTILRTPRELIDAGSKATVETEGYQSKTEGDGFNQSLLFYYYFGDEYSAGGTASQYKPVDYNGEYQRVVKGSEETGYTMATGAVTLGQSLAGHWWEGIKDGDVKKFLGYDGRHDMATWKARMPSYINVFYGTEIILDLYKLNGISEDYHIKYFYIPWYLSYDADGSRKTFTSDPLPEEAVIVIPEYKYLEDGPDGELVVVTVPEHVHEERNANGSVTLTYEEIASMERSRRAPQYSVVMNNVILGSSPKFEKVYKDGKQINMPINEPNPNGVITDGLRSVLDSGEVGTRGYVYDIMTRNNCMIYDYEDLMPYAYTFDYTLSDDAWDFIMDVGAEDPNLTIEEEALEDLKWVASNLYTLVGPTYDGFDESIYFEEVYADFDWDHAENEGFYWKEDLLR